MTPARTDPWVPEPISIKRIARESADTATLVLDTSERPGGFAFKPGQFNMLYAFGIGEVPISISGDPSDTGELVHTIRVVGKVTEALTGMAPGSTLGLRGPFGTHWPLEEARGRDVLIVAGGLGLVPLRPAIYEILKNRSAYKRVNIVYGARTPQDILFSNEISEWRGRLDVSLRVTVDSAGSDWFGHVGVVTSLVKLARFDPEATVAMVCGPEIMMRFAVRELETQGIADERIYLSTERNLQCGVGLCGHCQHGNVFVCKDGPVFRYDRLAPFFSKREV